MVSQKYRIDWIGRSIKYDKKDINTVCRVLTKSNTLTQGVYLEKFETKVKKYLNVKNVYGVTSGASALELAALSLGLKKNDEIIVPAHTYCATIMPFCRYNVKIVWADIDLETRNISIRSVKSLITKKTKAIIGVHLYGLPCEINELQKICKRKKIVLIEDCAQSFGASINNKKVGTFGDIAIFSMHAQKNITTMGEGGIIVVNNNKYNIPINSLRHNGHEAYQNKTKYWKPAMVNVVSNLKGAVPFNFPLTEAQSALGINLIAKLDRLNTKRIKRANIFKKKLIKHDEIFFQKENKRSKHVYHLMAAFVDRNLCNYTRDDLISILSLEYGIKCIIQYYPLYRYDFFKKYKNMKNSNKCINTNLFYDNMISFPFHVWMSDKDFKYLVRSVDDAIHKLKLKNTII